MSLSLSAGDDDFATEYVSLSEANARIRISEARKVARNIVSEAYQNSNSETYESWNTIFKKLKTVEIRIPGPKTDFEDCGESRAYAPIDSNRVYFCNKSLYQNYYNTYQLAQILIHEVTHALGEFDECASSAIEYSAMRMSGYGVQLKNPYVGTICKNLK